jgi:peptidoglycan-associated lipoprotein
MLHAGILSWRVAAPTCSSTPSDPSADARRNECTCLDRGDRRCSDISRVSRSERKVSATQRVAFDTGKACAREAFRAKSGFGQLTLSRFLCKLRALEEFNPKNMTRRLAVVVVFCAALSACHKKVPPQVPAPPPPPPPQAAARPETPPPPAAPPPPAPVSTPAPPPLTEDEVFARKSLEQLNAEHPLADVYFDLDEATIRDDARPVLQKDVEWLKRWTSTKITIEGHCDSRASAEYNLALGSRRAAAVKEYVASLGIQADRVTVVSKGKEDPICREENEDCWQRNRRGHFIVTAK